jgi:hypothetical protein
MTIPIEIQRYAYFLIPDALSLILISLVMVLVWNVSRVTTIRHYLKRHMDSMVASEMVEKNNYIKMLETENESMLAELKISRRKLKIVRNAMMVEE